MKIQNLVLTATLLIGISATAKTIHVTTGQDSVPGSLRAAVNESVSGDVIEIDNSVETMMLDNGEINIAKDLTLTASHPVTIDAQNKSRVFLIGSLMKPASPFTKYNTVSPTVHINGITFINGFNNQSTSDETGLYTAGGGAIHVHAKAHVLIENCRFENNYATIGGAITGTSRVQFPQTIEIRNSVFRNNKAFQGGAIQTFWSFIKSYNNIFIENHAQAKGGAMDLAYSCNDIRNTSIVGNTAQEAGGISNRGFLKMSDSLISENTATIIGGGLTGGYIVKIENSSITNNHAPLNADLGNILPMTNQGLPPCVDQLL